MNWTWPGSQTITNSWNATVTSSGAAVTANSLSYNGAIGVGGNTSFGIQANGTASAIFTGRQPQRKPVPPSSAFSASAVRKPARAASRAQYHPAGVYFDAEPGPDDAEGQRILQMGDGIARVYGLNNAVIGEILSRFIQANQYDLVLFGSQYDNQFAGSIDDVSLYGYALSSTQVLAHYFASGVAPLIILNPTNTTASEGANAFFYAGASGTPPLALQWYEVTTGTPVARSHTRVVSRWLVMPIARTPRGGTPEAASASFSTRRLVVQISSASCSTEPGAG